MNRIIVKDADLEDAKYNAKASWESELNYIDSLGICTDCAFNDCNENCDYYKMPFRVIKGRKKKCKRFKERLL